MTFQLSFQHSLADLRYKTNLKNVIKGWTEGITYFKEGGNGVLLVPSRLAYGPDYYNGIPGGSVLIFDVALISVY
ncbi:MAG: FKBP-type peptidyl-prolyl cis-trans isomerase [Flavobacteriaceae bacterium]|uniref:FKBP-type peptidyl-prolyl cis-trans isomerase n=1 Tax=Mariniflexile sp. TaxID=1979402 RepID=UPI003C9593EE